MDEGLQQRQTEFAAIYGITYKEYKMLVSVLQLDEIITCLELLKPKKHLSSFRQSMETKVRHWLAGGGALKPLTPREFEWSKPKWPVKYQLPQ